MALAFGLVLAATLAAIAFVDIRQGIIPDLLNLVLAGVGLVWSAFAAGLPAANLAGAAIAFAALWGLRAGFGRLRGTTGLGLGDVKMAAASALWISPWNLPLLLGIACLAALGFVGMQSVCRPHAGRRTAIPFGPFLGAGLMLTLILETSGLPTLVPNGG